MNKRTPERWPVAARTPDGAPYCIRPITPADAARERDFIARLSPESRYRRFLHAMREPSAAFIEQLVTVDHHFRMALVAVTGEGADERIIGVTRYAADEGSLDCEFAVAVADEWQGRGVGTNLAHRLFEHAAREGFRSIYGVIQPDNERMFDLARHLGLEIDTARGRQDVVRARRRLS